MITFQVNSEPGKYDRLSMYYNYMKINLTQIGCEDVELRLCGPIAESSSALCEHADSIQVTRRSIS